ncbi:MAG: hypothetical protein AB2A00_25620 [Myxococcota bacterium]
MRLHALFYGLLMAALGVGMAMDSRAQDEKSGAAAGAEMKDTDQRGLGDKLDEQKPLDTGVDTGTTMGDVDTGTKKDEAAPMGAQPGVDTEAPVGEQAPPAQPGAGGDTMPQPGAQQGMAAPVDHVNMVLSRLDRLEKLVNDLDQVSKSGGENKYANKINRNIKDMREKIADLRKKVQDDKDFTEKDYDKVEKDLGKLKVKFADTAWYLPADQQERLGKP